jgi:hypothetical protein
MLFVVVQARVNRWRAYACLRICFNSRPSDGTFCNVHSYLNEFATIGR